MIRRVQYETKREPGHEEREAAQSEIDRLIANPPPKRERKPDAFEVASNLGDSVAEFWMRQAMKHTGMTREQIMAEWARGDAAPVSTMKTAREIACRRARSAGVPEEFFESVIAKDPIDCQPLRRVKTFLESPQRFLMLAGGKGTWKTGSACWALGQHEDGKFVHARDLVRLRIEHRAKFDELLAAPILVLDNLGSEQGDRGAFMTAYDEIFDNSYMRRRKLLMTGNGTWEDFSREPDQRGYGSLVADRFEQYGGWYDVTGESRRRSLRVPSHWTEQREPGCDDE